ncbi:esterase/lipase family protein [Vibrio sp. MA40-2]|uniref:esterase/lipase family protein n=1 Tax=Vibrio sp. MA40-2 TaxID=3391828 RepID=UPI0039A72D4A
MFIRTRLSLRFVVLLITLIIKSSPVAANGEMVDVTSLFNHHQVKRCSSDTGPLYLYPDQPLVLVVHGCRSSAGQFKALSEVYNHLGEQTACFEYDDRVSLETVSGELVDAINALSPIIGEERIVVLGHSQGGLIARRAHTQRRSDNKSLTHKNIDLVTISAPFNGINASSHCGIDWLRIASLGLVDTICYLVTGSKYLEIPPQAEFIELPGKLAKQVQSHLVIKTDEVDTCRQYEASGECLKEDYVFSLDEQKQNLVGISEPIIVKAGHVEIVGNEMTTPWKLINILQEHGLMMNPDDAELERFTQVVNKIYHN